MCEFGSLRLVRCTFTEGVFFRRAREVAATTEECIGLVALDSGTEGLEQDGKQAVLTTGTMTAWDSARPVECRVLTTVTKSALYIPRNQLLSGVSRPDVMTMQPLAHSPAYRMLRGLMDQLVSFGPALDATTGAAAAHAVIELARAVCLQSLPVTQSWDDEALVLLAKEYIERHLSDAGLGPERVARALRVSLRRLYNAFSSTEMPVSAYIRSQRLDRAYREITTWPPVRPIATIARTVGFSDPSHFARAFRATYGERPSAVRERMSPPESADNEVRPTARR